MAKAFLALVTLVFLHSSIHGLVQIDLRVPNLKIGPPALQSEESQDYLNAKLNTFPIVLPKESQEYLKAHNDARAKVGVEPLIWNHHLANLASRLVRGQKGTCKFLNLTASQADQYGGNQLRAREVRTRPRAAVNAWVRERRYYNYSTNSCDVKGMCETYIQVVWRKTHQLGCSQATCGNYKGSLTLCLYNPPGNYGEWPY